MQGAVLEESKSALRRAVLTRRRSLSPETLRSWNRSIQTKALGFPHYITAEAVTLYSPIENEVGTDTILADALERKKQVFYPRIDDQESAWFFEISSATEFRAGRFGIPEPVPIKALTVADWQDNLIVFVPGVAFDLGGHRLGRGGGWYDRMLDGLKNRGVFVGLAFEFQVVDRLTTEAWDQKVHYVITERRVIDCGVSTP
jgi:5-formyltetrahydrofolate cyclo-ligase